MNPKSITTYFLDENFLILIFFGIFWVETEFVQNGKSDRVFEMTVVSSDVK